MKIHAFTFSFSQGLAWSTSPCLLVGSNSQFKLCPSYMKASWRVDYFWALCLSFCFQTWRRWLGCSVPANLSVLSWSASAPFILSDAGWGWCHSLAWALCQRWAHWMSGFSYYHHWYLGFYWRPSFEDSEAFTQIYLLSSLKSLQVAETVDIYKGQRQCQPCPQVDLSISCLCLAFCNQDSLLISGSKH